MSTSSTSLQGATGAGTQPLQLLIFSLNSEEFAFHLTDVREIMNLPAVTPVPNTIPSIRGVVNARGKVMTIVDIARLLGFPDQADNRKQIIVADRDNELFGLLVDNVTEVLRAPADLQRDVPETLHSGISADFVEHVIVMTTDAAAEKTEKAEKKDRLILVLNIQKILATVGSIHS